MDSQEEYKQALVDKSNQLETALCYENYCHRRVVEVVDRIPPKIFQLTKVGWNSEIQNLVLQLKRCMVYNDPTFYHLFLYKLGDETQSLEKPVDSGLMLSKKVCVILGMLSEKMNGKENYGLLHTLVESVGSQSYRFRDLLNYSSSGNLIISLYIDYTDLFQLLKTVTFRAKSQLANAESRVTSEVLFDGGEVPFKSLSVEMANVLKELLEVGLEILSGQSIKSENLNLDTVSSFIYEIANACSLDRLDPKVFESFSLCVAKLHATYPKLHPRKTFTSLCNVLLKHDPEITAGMKCLTAEKPLFRHGEHERYANSILVDCYHSIQVWLSAVYLRSPYILGHSTTAESDFKLLATLCRTKSFSECLFRDCSLLLDLIVCALRSSVILERNISKGYYYANLRAEPATVLNVIVEATSLLSLVVSLCSQKCNEDTCSWIAFDDEAPRDSALNGFVETWTVILELMPQLVESQMTNIPNGILNSVAEFGESLFSLLRETPLQRMIITTVLVYCSSEIKTEIRAKAGRALARLIEFNCLSEDISFSMDAFDAIKLNMKAPELSVRISFSWAFGNWSDLYLHDYLTSGGDTIAEHNHMVSDFYEIIRHSYEAKAKVRYNIFRGAGNLLKFIQCLDSDNAERIKEIVLILIDQVGKGFDFKARWNACCALRNVFSNPCLLKSLEPEVKNRTMQCFIKHMTQSENFKERIQCVVGASSVYSRTVYGDYYLILWDKLATASSVEPPEFQSEVGQAEKLNIEVGRSYIHLTSLLLVEDLERLEAVINAKWEQIEHTMKFSLANCPLDDFKDLELAVRNLEKLMKSSLRPFELEVCRTIYSTLSNRSLP